jgi:hypothetical protein
VILLANQQSNITSPVSASETGVNHNDNEIGIGKTESNPIGLKVVGKIDISKFEKPKRELVQGKENIYIIDTNVFVDYPDIILKIEKQYPIILSAKVLDELDKLKATLDSQGKIECTKIVEIH